MNILGIETTTERLSAALLIDNFRILERREDTRSAHCELLAKFVTDLTEEAGISLEMLDGIAVSIGPGSFTGLRIGIATAMGLSYGLGVKTCGVGTLEALAWNTGIREGLVCPLIDAKRAEAYTAIYRMNSERPEPVVEPSAVPMTKLAELFTDLKEPVTITGPAVEKFRPLLESAQGPKRIFMSSENAKPSAVSVAQIGVLIFEAGMGVGPAELEPLYLRRSDAELAKMKRSEFCV
jgi:tRNA threonylcarbamoyladenosine biosynthesis protein TsaB